MIPAGGEGRPARGGPHDSSRAGHSCWLCGRPIEDPPQIIGHWSAMGSRVAHRRCLQVLGELELDLQAGAGPDPSNERSGPA